jgi:hypothetical protein
MGGRPAAGGPDAREQLVDEAQRCGVLAYRWRSPTRRTSMTSARIASSGW